MGSTCMPSKQGSTTQRFQFDSLVLNSEIDKPLFRQLEEQLRDAIWSERLKAGERLPSTRGLATELEVGRNTVINAYEQLVVEGFIVTEKGSGTRVADNFPEHKPKRRKPLQSSSPDAVPDSVISEGVASYTFSDAYESAKAISFAVPLKDGDAARPFRAHTPACRDFPKALWAQLTNRRLKHMSWSWLDKSNSCGYEPLREAISGYLGASRGISTDSDEVFVVAGVQQGVELLAKLLINPGDVVVFEEPGYTPAAIAFEMAGAQVVSIPVDNEGLDVDVLNATVREAKLVYVTPASHFPLGKTMSQCRRKALLNWANKVNALIIEDDYNGEYQYRGRPLATLFSMAEQGRVIYFGSFSKLLFPALRLGYMVVSPDMMTPLATLRWLVDRHSPPLEQAVLADFINDGHFARHLRRMRTLYVERQKALVQQAEIHLNEIMSVPPLDSGMHLIGWLNQDVEESDVLAAAGKSDLEIMPTSGFCLKPNRQPSVILGYASFTPKEIEAAVIALKLVYLAENRD